MRYLMWSVALVVIRLLGSVLAATARPLQVAQRAVSRWQLSAEIYALLATAQRKVRRRVRHD